MAKPLSTEQRNARDRAIEIAAEIRRRYRPRDPALVRPGFLRGIDTYRPAMLIAVIANILMVYNRKAGRYPDLLQPELYSEKLCALKLFAFLKVPETGNKLLTGHFLPPQLSGQVMLPRILWYSRTPQLPPDGSLAPGEYYLKSNHGSGWCRRIRYPLDAEAREALEAETASWLKSTYQMMLGEWWYNVFPRAIFIEACVTERNPSAVLLYYVFRGRTGIISVDEKRLDGSNLTRVSLHDPDFRLLQSQPDGTERVEGLELSEETKARARAAAEAIAAPYEAVRVDFLPGESGQLYLNEVTVCSNAGLPLSNLDRDKRMGELWGPCGFTM